MFIYARRLLHSFIISLYLYVYYDLVGLGFRQIAKFSIACIFVFKFTQPVTELSRSYFLSEIQGNLVDEYIVSMDKYHGQKWYCGENVNCVIWRIPKYQDHFNKYYVSNTARWINQLQSGLNIGYISCHQASENRNSKIIHKYTWAQNFNAIQFIEFYVLSVRSLSVDCRTSQPELRFCICLPTIHTFSIEYWHDLWILCFDVAYHRLCDIFTHIFLWVASVPLMISY